MDAPSHNLGDRVEKKRLKDKGRLRRGNHHKKRLHILFDESCKAFRGWQHVKEPWSSNTCELYIEWCHISKLWPVHRFNAHRKSDKANLHSCQCPIFTERCIQVSQYVYRTAKVPRNEVNLSISRMVYAEVVLEKSVDWRTLYCKPGGTMTTPTTEVIPKTRLFQGIALGRKISKDEIPNDQVEWSETSSDDSNTGCSPRTRRGILDNIKGRWLDQIMNQMVDEDTRSHKDAPPIDNVDFEVVAHEEHGQPSKQKGKEPIDINPPTQEHSTRFETKLEEHLTKHVEEYKLKIQDLEFKLQEREAELQKKEEELRERDKIIAILRNS